MSDIPNPQVEHLDLPEYLTWEKLEQLPEEIAGQIELWDGRVVWNRRGSPEHQMFTLRLATAFEAAIRKDRVRHPAHCWRPGRECNVFLGKSDKSDFVTPDFLVHRCLSSAHQDVGAEDVLLVGEVLSPSNKYDIEEKKDRYAGAGIPWYWEVLPDRESSVVVSVRAYGLMENVHGPLPEGVRPLHPANYVAVGRWTRDDVDGVVIDHPFPIRIPWSELVAYY